MIQLLQTTDPSGRNRFGPRTGSRLVMVVTGRDPLRTDQLSLRSGTTVEVIRDELEGES
jgi:hypothetical protein